MLAFLALAATISTDFEAGRLGRVEQVAPLHFRCAVAGETDQDGRNRQANWYYFRLNGALGREVTIDLIDLAGEYNYRPNRGAVTKDTIPVYSSDGTTWKHFPSVEYDAAGPVLRIRFTPQADPVWIAHVPPYTNADLASLLQRHRGSPFLRIGIAGKSLGDRNIPLLAITDPGAPAAAKKSIWLMFRQHSWEAGSSWAGEGAIDFLLSPDPVAARMRKEAVFHILPLCDPDGVARGGVRFNAKGYDLNRNWDTPDPALMPEIWAERRAILDSMDRGEAVDILVSLHNTETAEYLEGPPETEAGRSPRAAPDAHVRPSGADALMRRFEELLRERGTFNPTRPARHAEPTTTPGKPGRMTVVQGLYRDRQIPAFLIEQMIAFNNRLGRLPTIDDRKQFGASLARAAFEAVRGEEPAGYPKTSATGRGAPPVYNR